MSLRLERLDPTGRKRFKEAFSLEGVNRNCSLQAPPKINIKPLQVRGEFVGYASPESTFAVTKAILEGAQKSILIGIYDFTAQYVKQLLLRALGRGVKISLMLDLDGRSGEGPLFDELKRHGVQCVPAPSCASRKAQFFASSHEKVIVVDETWVLVQSGNWSDASIPQNETDGGDPTSFSFGNRDMGIAIRSSELSKFFARVLRADMLLEQRGVAPQRAQASDALFSPEAFGAKPKAPAPRLLSSKRWNPGNPVRVTPVLTPDNYMSVVPGFLQRATVSIDIEQQYIRPRQPNIQKLLQSIASAVAKHPQLKVRIVLGHPMSAAHTRDIGSLKSYGLKMGNNVRLISRKHFVHCHNKLVIVDGKDVLVSSQNWSDYAVVKNREAGLLLEFPQAAKYFQSIFDVDWQTGERKLPKGEAPEVFTPQSLASGQTIPLNWGDYAEV